MVNFFDYASDEERLRVEERLHPPVTPEEKEKSRSAWARINEDYRLAQIAYGAADRSYWDWERKKKEWGLPPDFEAFI
jgi:hypothetical protein